MSEFADDKCQHEISRVSDLALAGVASCIVSYGSRCLIIRPGLLVVMDRAPHVLKR